MKASELRQLSKAELQVKLDDAKEELFNLRFQREVGQLENITRVRVVKRNIARILTIMTERGLEAAAND